MIRKIALKVKNQLYRYVTLRHLNQNNPLLNVELHAVLSNRNLRKRNDIEIGRYSYGNPNVRTGGGIARLVIGKFCEFGPDVSIHLVSDHHTNWITPYDLDVLANGRPNGYEPGDLVYKGDVIIGNDVWIGEKTIILPGVEIGDGCIIGAGSVVTKSVEPYSVVAGNPCRLIRKRYDENSIRKLMEICWWDWDDIDIYHAISVLQSDDIDLLYKTYERITHKSN